ncbi:hypothetical protein [Pseudomonas sp. NBRC 111118]|uniref:hypothetical protein n=1 Tax=Pseudomonas sp. NBRC 111118 TaxID=1661033 RepID=UPI0006D4484A|nr:hypothetical protein [Pseudomonas sp. NBRC 111118]
MSLETEIAALTTEARGLLNYFTGIRASINDTVAKAVAAVPTMKKIFYLNALSGSDTNDGLTSDKPLKTIEKAVAMTPVGGVCSLRLQTDYDMTTEINIENIKVELRSDVIATKRTLRPKYFKSTDGLTTYIANFAALLGAEVSLRDMTLVMPTATAVTPAATGGGNAFLKVNASSPATMLGVKLVNCDVTDEAGATAFLTSGSVSGLVLSVTGTTFPAGFAGRYCAAVAAGTSASAVNNLVTNLNTL